MSYAIQEMGGVGREREKEGKRRRREEEEEERETERETYVELIFKPRPEGWKEPARHTGGRDHLRKRPANAQSHC